MKPLIYRLSLRAKTDFRQKVYYNHSNNYLSKLSKREDRGYVEFLEFADDYIQDRDRKVLEIGCGTGRLAYLASTKWVAKKITAIDVSKKLITVAGKKYHHKNLSFEVGNLFRLPYTDKAFDVVLLHDVVEHIPNVPFFLSELNRVVSPNGMVIISSPSMINPKLPYLDFLKNRHRLPYTVNRFDNILLFLFDITIAIYKVIAPVVHFIYIIPILGEKYAAIPDTDAVYLANPVDLSKSLKKLGFKILNASRFRLSHPKFTFVSFLFDPFYSIRIVARRK